ncbi:type II toxin-antitoxin system VapC family toxin [Endozoicomonas acroporae]|uniref:type II toxin-antitoxin system VapC family toxin n=1 Tax=Endozoicomonas acroporae TaxID=1701104 RepID=UPI0013D1EA19|nr:type II toxin-antitoxin system VapC family toxin [Endozoicomonas acroporae]
MKSRHLLLDTHAFLWWLDDSPRLGQRTRSLIANAENVVYVSAASMLEIAIKKRIGKLNAPDQLASCLEDEGFSPLSITPHHAGLSGLLPMIHKDPFDRLLVAQAQADGLELISVDAVFPRYQVRLVNAGE